MSFKSPMDRREFIRTGLTGAAALTAGTAFAQGQAAPRKRPNLVFVFTDQQSWDTLGCYGNEQAVTPHLDRFATQGAQVSHCVSNYPVCTPFRGMLFSGQHPLDNGAIFNDFRMRPGNGKYFGECLSRGGYHTGYVGKWHLYGGNHNRPIPPGEFRYGFDDTFLSNNVTLEFAAGEAYYWNERGEKVFYDQWEPYGQTEQAKEFIRRRPGDQPFALFVSYHPPHDAGKDKYPAPDHLMKLYEREALKLRPDLRDAPRQRQEFVREMLHGYMAMVSGVDRAFGDLMKTLDEEGLAEDTIVVFTSDHGDALYSNHRSIPKGFIEDPSVRTPLLVRWPGRIPPGEIEMLFGTLDFMPTLLSLMDVPVPDTCAGHDLSRALLRGSGTGTPEIMPMFHLANGLLAWRGLYTPRYTYSFGEEPLMPLWGSNRSWNTNCLYDRVNDPHQTENRYDDPELRSLRKEFFERTGAISLERFGDRFVPGHILERATLGLPLLMDRNEFMRARHSTDGIPVAAPRDCVADIPGVFDQYL